MKCPECGTDNPAGAAQCKMCRVVFAKLRAPREPEAAQRDRGPGLVAEGGALPPNRLTQPILGYCLGGLALAILATAWGWLRVAGQGLNTLFHEFGHSVAGWLFARPSVPAFDLAHGGGVALIHDRSPALLIVIYLVLAGLILLYRRNWLTLALLLGLVGLHAWLVSGRGEKVVIGFMGHGGELLFGLLFLYRGLTGRTVAHELERLAYAACGWFVVLNATIFAWGLTFSGFTRAWYARGHGGGIRNDFEILARDHFHVGIETVSGFYLLLCLLTPLAAFLAFRYQARLYCLIDALVATHPEAAEEPAAELPPARSRPRDF